MVSLEDKYLYIVRHGETEFNRLNIVQGSGVDTDLNATGIRQANLFHAAYGKHPFDKVYTSALRRTQQSVQAFIDAGIPHEKLPGLNEICWGDIEGRPQTPEQKMRYWEVVTKWNAGELDARVMNGESPLEMCIRQQEALQQIMRHTAERQVLICMHGRAMKSFLCQLLDVPLDRMEEFQHSNLCLYVVKHNGEGFELVMKNDISHLDTQEKNI
jgi:probable phosphoglycerate mutase